MSKTARGFVAEERSTYIAKAIADWRKIAIADGEALGSARQKSYWNATCGYWSFFGTTDAKTPRGWRYWNAFGTARWAQWTNILVEINPPQAGIAGGTQGLIARDRTGGRWILHGGRIHPGRGRVDTDTFRQLSGLETVEVEFSDRSFRDYFVVAPLDRGHLSLHESTATFLERCAYVRNAFLYGVAEADLDQRVDEGEQSSKPEQDGKYVVPARDSVEAERTHAEVWKALAAELDRRQIEHTNARVGRYGPDLRTRNAPFALVEIKTDISARSLYEALGQLLMYERMLGKAYSKALVVPSAPPARLAAILSEFKVELIIYRKAGRSYGFDRAELASVFKETRSVKGRSDTRTIR